MADAAVVEVLAPFRSKQGFTALSARNDRPRQVERTNGLRLLLHGTSSLEFFSGPRRSPRCAAVISPICDGIVTGKTLKMKQRA